MASTSTSTSNVYIHVIEDVINKVREEFVNDGGPGDSVLAELQGVIIRLFLLILIKLWILSWLGFSGGICSGAILAADWEFCFH